MDDDDFLKEIKEHTSEDIDIQTLKKSVQQNDLDTIDVVE
jgi:hypothetical protein